MVKKSNVMTNRIIYSGWDFEQANSALLFLLEECDFEKKYNLGELRRLRCFETTMIISFSRPFKTGLGKKPLDLEVIGLELSDAEIELKKKITTLRDQVVAHSDVKEMEFYISNIRPFDDHDVRMPLERFYEGLRLNEQELTDIYKLLNKIIYAIAMFKFDFVQVNPGEYNRHKVKSKD